MKSENIHNDLSADCQSVKKRGAPMKKILQIGWKDLRVIFRDRAALILMLVAPFVLTVGDGTGDRVTGRPPAVASARYR